MLSYLSIMSAHISGTCASLATRKWKLVAQARDKVAAPKITKGDHAKDLAKVLQELVSNILYATKALILVLEPQW